MKFQSFPISHCWFPARHMLTRIVVGFLFVLAVSVGILRADNKACEKTCLDKEEGPCSGLTGKPLAVCLGNCHKACNPPPPPPPLLAPGCSDRSIQGKIQCTIVKPNVAVPKTTYESVIRFAPGDIVDVRANGCVQTGGHGNTWKRYVNPADDEGGKYHGLMQIPTAYPAGSGLIPIENFIGRLQTVRGDPNVPVEQLFLTLGYTDSDYSDNSYDSPDDGTRDQCKTQGAQDGTPAHVTITIYRGVAPDTPQSPFDFDVLPTMVTHPDNSHNTDADRLGLDHNGLLLNPSWSWQQRCTTVNGKQQCPNQNNFPSSSMCHDFSTRDSFLGIPGSMIPYFGDCTDQTDEGNVDIAEGFNGAACYWGKGGPLNTGSFPGHVDWFPVTINGSVKWGSHELWDDDYDFNFYPQSPGNQLILSGRDALHAEFDSDETIDNFHTDEWNQLHTAIDNAEIAKGGLDQCSSKHNCDQQRIDELQAIVDVASKHFDGTTVLTGMFGLDGEHDLKAELHPVYAMATLRDSRHFEDDPLDEVWLMFARNRGDEGFCSSRLWDSGFETYVVRLRWLPGATAVQVNQGKTHFEGTEGTSGPDFMIVPPGSADTEGVYAIFHLGPASSAPFIDGAVHLIWTTNPNAQHVGVGTITGTYTSTSAQTTIKTAPTSMAAANTAGLAKATAAEVKPATTQVAPGKPVATQSASTQPAEKRPAADGQVENPGEVDELLRNTARQLTPEQSQAVAKARPPVTPRAGVHELPPGKVQTVSALPAGVEAAQARAINAGPATAKNNRNAAQIKALCDVTKNAPPGLPAETCTKPSPAQSTTKSPAAPPPSQ